MCLFSTFLSCIVPGRRALRLMLGAAPWAIVPIVSFVGTVDKEKHQVLLLLQCQVRKVALSKAGLWQEDVMTLLSSDIGVSAILILFLICDTLISCCGGQQPRHNSGDTPLWTLLVCVQCLKYLFGNIWSIFTVSLCTLVKYKSKCWTDMNVY